MEDKNKTEAVDSDDLFEIDIENHSTDDLDGAFQEAVAAVSSTEDSEDEEPAEIVEDEVSAEASPDVERLRAENRSLRERLVRTLADFDNYRKRTDREKKSLSRFAIFDVVKDFLQVADNLERATAASGKLKDLKMGLGMVIRQQEDILRRYGVEKIESVGHPFDPTVHEAVSREESDEVDAPMVTSEHQGGYLLYDRLLRPAMVTVAVPMESPQSPESEDVVGETDETDETEAENAEGRETSNDEVEEEVEQLTE